MNEVFKKLKPYLDKSMAIGSALALISWDNETLAPKEAIDNTAKVIGILSGESFQTLINPEVKKILDELKGETDLSDFEKKVFEKLYKEYKKMESIPTEEYIKFSELTTKAGSVWQKAKAENDFNLYAPYLKEIIAYTKKFAAYQNSDGKKLYDVLLDEYEEGFTMDVLDEFFSKLKAEIVPLLAKVDEKNDEIDKSFIFKSYDIEKQRSFNRWLAEYVGFDFGRGVLAESEHPFTNGSHNHDVRITTHYYENNLESAIFSTIHEAGHAIYEMGIDDKYTQTILGGGTSCGTHESQSRFFENMIGRSEKFWEPIYGKLVELFPEQLQDVNLEKFILGINKAEPSLIRVESDELTYCLHIMVRYEIEKLFIENEVDVYELPKIWNEKYKEYLGIQPKTDSEGILQDIHWSMGSVGYFPSYALGNAFAAQMYHQMKKDIPVDSLLKEGKLEPIVSYLGEHVHKYGASKEAMNILKDMTGESFNVDYYITYLKDKYTKLYNL